MQAAPLDFDEQREQIRRRPPLLRRHARRLGDQRLV
jgi:hypothetical protein